MTNFIIYLLATGEIIRFYSVAFQTVTQTEVEIYYPDFDDATEGFIIVTNNINPRDYYVDLSDNDTVKPRPLFSNTWTFNKTTIDADGSDTATIGSGLPNPTRCIIQNNIEGTTGPEPFDITDGSLAITVPTPGIYTIMLSKYPYKDEIFTITGVEP